MDTAMPAIERYYVKVKGSVGAKVQHRTLAEAYTEAKRLLAMEGKRVYVLQVIGVLDPPVDKNGGAVK